MGPGDGVSAVDEETQGISLADRGECTVRSLHQCLKAPGLLLPQQRLHLREGLFYGVEVGRVGGQEHQRAAAALDELAHPFRLVHLQVVHDHDLPGLQVRAQEPLDVERESLPIGRPLYAHRRAHPLRRDRADERHVLVPVLGRLPACPLALGRPRPQRHHPDVSGGLVHEDKAPRVYTAVAPPPSAPGPFVSLGGTQRLFLSVHPSSWRMARLIVAKDTRTPRAPSHSSQWRSRVASSFSSSCSHNARLSSALERMRRLRPPERFGSRSSPSRRRLTQRLMVERETPKSSETSSRGRPRSTAPSTRSLRSFEYAFMTGVLAGTIRFANRSSWLPRRPVGLEVAVERRARHPYCLAHLPYGYLPVLEHRGGQR